MNTYVQRIGVGFNLARKLGASLTYRQACTILVKIPRGCFLWPAQRRQKLR